MTELETFAKFVEAINARDAGALAALMTGDHLFVDSLGSRVRGAEDMAAAWQSYFTFCPDYAVHVEEALAEQGIVLACGAAGGTIDGVEWRIPAAWKAVIRGGKVAEWRVFADNKPVYEILSGRK